jgi:hypothetical protein
MVVVHERVLGRVREQVPQAPAPPADRDYHKLDAVVIEKIPDRSIKAKAPDYIQPTGLLTLPEAIDRLFRNYEVLTGVVESTPVCASTSWRRLRSELSPTEHTILWTGISGR